MFWRRQLIDRSSDHDIMLLLDQCSTRLTALQLILDDRQLGEFTIGLLAKGLELHGDSIDSTRIYEWSGVGLDKFGHPNLSTGSDLDRIRFWFDSHVSTQREILKIGLDRCVEEGNPGYCMFKVKARLYNAKTPTDHGEWCLAEMRGTTSDAVARFFLKEAVETIQWQRIDDGFSLETISEAIKNSEKYKNWLKEMLFCPIDPEEQSFKKEWRVRVAERKNKQRKWVSLLKSHQSGLQEGHAHIRLLNDLANAYFGYFSDSVGETPIERLLNLLGDDQELVQSVLQALMLTPERDDLPEVGEIFQLYVKNETYLLCRPVIAGLQEKYGHEPDGILQLDNDKIRQVLAFYMTEQSDQSPAWHKSLLKSQPDLFATVMTEYVIAGVRGDKEHLNGVYALAYDDEYAQIATLAALPMLKSFPARCTSRQLGTLGDLLKAALRFSDRLALRALVGKKLALRSMNVAQRVRWLAAGLIIAPENYQDTLSDFTLGNENRIRHLAGFFANRYGRRSSLEDLPVSSLGLLVRVIGSNFAPYSVDGFGWVSPAMEAADFVSTLVGHLESLPGQEATVMLDSLLEDIGLQPWKNTLQRAKYEQGAVRREASFKHPRIAQVSATLNNQTPANVGDLSALVLYILKDMAEGIRNGNTDDYRQFWNESSYRQLDRPKHEDSCRDTLLSDLQRRLSPLEIDAQPEGQYADDKRSDIRVSFAGANGFAVPVEIKKNTHVNLWRALHEQLIAKYTRDPQASGFGIYLVFWFGADITQLPPSGQRPRNAQELENRLRSSLSFDEKLKISVCVIDVSKPD